MERTKDIPIIGEPFPNMTVPTTQGTITLPDDFAGSWFILFSHPGDFTPVCTTEYVAFQEMYPKFRKINTKLIGLSVDQVYAHLKWLEWIRDKLGVNIEFPVIADGLGQFAARLGMFPAEGSTATIRGVFVVDDQGTIRQILYYPSELGRNMNELYRSVYGLQVATKSKVALPADWPNNQLIGDAGIIPPAGTVQEIQQRMQQKENGLIDCFDWWFCYKDIKNRKKKLT
ncbi:peroxiredoxin (alkyl hydroperoxide reductase subunit C) [Melghiribacillus thermohalophilus]|uniref:Peroxiredoxin n=1 Tax=Melghiribacillus thermohalophilus TaxID=1324956 RepID=A0A4V2V0R5_9BACI|nr:peroxiredoxin [Melghiribacillus thermohalophilus]TCT17957.1 peroxiredoxin (alkyl hydroperoxide reductase subunit C) [Melghiribacillus thermohalophilus]